MGSYLVKLLSSYIYNMKIVTWNIRHGGGKRVKDIVGVIGSYSEEGVFIITEFRNNNNKDVIIKALNEVGFTRIQNTNSESKVNSVLIAAKFDYDVELFDELVENQQLKPSAYPLN
tara:strand:+ start:4246 stop:4593 length:348 start_codon:yes stop_codon:yes gene_type:complete